MLDRQNTINGWVLFAGVVALGASIVTGEIFHSERPEKMGYPIEGVAVEGEGGEAEKPIAFYLATADAAKGEAVFHEPRVIVEHTVAEDIEAERERVYSAFRKMREPSAKS